MGINIGRIVIQNMAL